MKLQLKKHQWEVYCSKARFRILVAGRRFGKTHLALVELLKAAEGKDRLVWYVGPNDSQSKRIAWSAMKELTRPFWSKKANETELRIDLAWGSTIKVNGAFKPDSLRGNGLDFVVLDEFASLQAELWTQIFRPALADRQGRALLIGTPQGRNHFYENFEYAQGDPDWEAFQFTTAQGELVSEAELTSVARQMDSELYKQEMEGQFTLIGRHRAYYAFERAEHVGSVRFQSLYPLIWSIDFNVNPMVMLLMQRVGEEAWVLEEIVVKPEANTELACQRFLERALLHYAQVPGYQRPLTVEIYGDASGNQKRTSGAETDWTIVKQFFKKWVGTFEPVYRIRTTNPVVRDRVNCVNSRLRNHLGDKRLMIDLRCVELIKDLEQVTWAVDSTGAATNELNKSDRARTHASDALGYYISQIFSMKPKVGEQGRPLFGPPFG